MRWHLILLVSICGLAVAESGAAAPWLPHLAALTDPRPMVHEPAMESLMAYGEPAVADVITLVGDAEWGVRARAATVLAGIGGPLAARTLIGLSTDTDARVRAVVASALGRVPGEGVFDSLARLLGDRVPQVRVAAARGLSDLADPRAILLLADQVGELDAAVRAVRGKGLEALVSRPEIIPSLVAALGSAHGDVLLRLVVGSAGVGDPRLSPPLAALLTHRDVDVAALAAGSLSVNGDSRCLEALCIAASGTAGQLADTAAATLRSLTGTQAAAGSVWQLWWRDNAAAVAKLAARDAYLAELHDPALPAQREALARFTPEELEPLIDGAVIGGGAWWWQRRATLVLLTDDPARWTPLLARRIELEGDGDNRLALVLLLDQLSDSGAAPTFTALRQRARERIAAEKAAGRRPTNHAEILALDIALERRSGSAPAPAPQTTGTPVHSRRQ